MTDPRTLCRDCGAETLPRYYPDRAEYYMVHDITWAAAGMEKQDGYLCIGCLEHRLGRQLTAYDFTDVRINDLNIADTPRYAWSFRTPRLEDRLRRRSMQLTLF